MSTRLQFAFIGLLWMGLASPAAGQLATANSSGVSFGHIHMNVSDVELHKKLWAEVLGGVVIEREGYTAVRVPGMLLFLRDAEPSAPSRGSAVDHFGFRVKDLGSALNEWTSLGYEVDREEYVEGRPPSAYITFPNGAAVELSEDPELESLAVMDHVHFVTMDAEAMSSWYEQMFGASVVSGDGGVVMSHVPGAQLVFATTNTEVVPIEGTAVDHVGFEVDSVESFVEQLRAEGIEIEFGPRHIESLDLWVAFFTDASGALIEVTQGLDW